MRPSATPRYCARCGARLASDNTGTACSPCQRTAREAGERPPEVPPEFWDNPQLRDSLIRDRHIGRAVRGYREHPFHGQKPISQSLAARWLNISQTQLSRIESGRPVHDLDRLIQWAKTLRIPPELLWFSLPDEADMSAHDRIIFENETKPIPLFVSPANYSEPVSLTPVFPSPDERERAEDATDVLERVQKIYRSAVRPDVISHLQESIRKTITNYESLDHSVLVPALRKQRAWIESLLEECGHPAQRSRLFEIAGAASGVLGYVSVGSGDFSLARAYCLEAFQLGEFAGDANLQAWARGLQSFCEYYAGRYDEALNLANDGLVYAKSGPQSVRLTINGVARAMGKLGDADGVDRAVDHAYELMSRNKTPDGVPSSISLESYSATQTASNAATAYVSLAIPEKVQYYVDLALPEINKSDSPWSRSLVLIDLAVSRVRAKNADLDHASTLVHDAVTISADRPIISVQQRTSEFVRDVVKRWGNVPQMRTIRDAASAAIERGK